MTPIYAIVMNNDKIHILPITEEQAENFPEFLAEVAPEYPLNDLQYQISTQPTVLIGWENFQ